MCVAAFSVALIPGLVSAQIIGVNRATNSAVFALNETTGTGITVGNSGLRGLNSLARDSGGTLFSVATLVDGSALLATIDPITGAGQGLVADNFGQVTPDVRGLAFSSNNTLFAINSTISDSQPDDLYTINVATGAGTFIGMTGLNDLQGLDFAPSGALFGWDVSLGLVTIDSLTGVATDVNPLVGASADIQSIVFAQDGTLFGARSALFTINPTTGETALVGAGGYLDLRGIEIVPEPSSIALATFGFVGLAAWGWRKKR